MGCQAYRSREGVRKCPISNYFPRWRTLREMMVGDDGIEPPTCPV